jgi:hypothetical protein
VILIRHLHYGRLARALAYVVDCSLTLDDNEVQRSASGLLSGRWWLSCRPCRKERKQQKPEREPGNRYVPAELHLVTQ